jgi:hypothetical protein
MFCLILLVECVNEDAEMGEGAALFMSKIRRSWPAYLQLNWDNTVPRIATKFIIVLVLFFVLAIDKFSGRASQNKSLFQ